MTTQTMAPKVLVVDDDPRWLRLVSLFLKTRSYQIATALDGEEAIRKVTDEPPDLVIADINMPGMDGFELCRRLRRNPVTRTIPFIFLTGRDQDQDRIKARKIGSDDYLTKPCPLEQLSQSVDQLIDRIQQARTIPLDEVGMNGRIEDVDLLDLIQTLELNQNTGALVLSHGERTATLYFKEGVIVEADIRSPKREEPLFILLGWPTGRFLFLPDVAPDRMPITASLANLLLQDLHTMQEHEYTVAQPSTEDMSQEDPPGSLTRQVLTRLEEVTSNGQAAPPARAHSTVSLRILIAGTRRSGKSELIHHLVKDLSRKRWAAVGIEEPRAKYRTDVGRVRISASTALHLIAVRVEKRFWPLWEQCLPTATGIILLADPQAEEAMDHIKVFLRAKQALAPHVPVQVLVPPGLSLPELPGLPPSAVSAGSLQDPQPRLTALDRVLQSSLNPHQRVSP